MKYAFMSFSTPKLTWTGMLDLARRLGYEGLEPRIGAGHAHGVEIDADSQQRRQLRQQAEQSGVAVACVATSCKYADPAAADQQVQATLSAIELAGDLGCPTIRVFGGALPEGLSRQDAVDLVAHSLRSVADHAQKRDVIVCMETHDHWTDPRHVAEVMRKVDHPAVAVNWDIMHPVRTAKASVEESFDILRPWIRHLHVHDGVDEGKLKLVPIGEGAIDHRAAVRLLKQAGYEGFLSGEWIKWEIPYDQHLPAELAALRAYEAQA